MRGAQRRLCTALSEHGVSLAGSAYYGHRSRSPAARAVRDSGLAEEVGRVLYDRELGPEVERDEAGDLMP